MKKLLLITILLFISCSLFGKETITGRFDCYKPIYFILGNKDANSQISFKTRLWKFDRKHFFYFGYTHYMLWDIYKDSGPVRETNYNPEFFYVIEKPFKRIDYIQISPFEHISDGEDGIYSRGVNNVYTRMQISKKKHKVTYGGNFGIYYSYMYSKRNVDILRYSGNNYAKVFVKFFSEEIYFKTHTYLWDEVRICNYELGLRFRILTDKVPPQFFIKYRGGYNESLLSYNEKNNLLRGGVIINY